MGAGADRVRLDKWLWHARFFKTRALAAHIVEKSGVRIDGRRVKKPGTAIKVGDTLTFMQQDRVRVVEVAALSLRRGPAAEAATLYIDCDNEP